MMFDRLAHIEDWLIYIYIYSQNKKIADQSHTIWIIMQIIDVADHLALAPICM